jgi:hypothetical protein
MAKTCSVPWRPEARIRYCASGKNSKRDLQEIVQPLARASTRLAGSSCAAQALLSRISADIVAMPAPLDQDDEVRVH